VLTIKNFLPYATLIECLSPQALSRGSVK